MRRLALVLLLTACASPTDVQSDVQNDVQSVRVETRYVGKLAWNVHSVCVKP